MKKIGILGGTFDPPHNGHVMMAAAALHSCGLDGLVLMPNGDPPHKKPDVSASDRLEMTKLAAGAISGIAGGREVTVSEEEISRCGPSYLADSLSALKRRMPDSRLYFIVGSDAASSMASWKRSEEIFRLCDIIVFNRKGCLVPDAEIAVRYLIKRGANAEAVGQDIPDISSTYVRKLISEHGDYESMVPATVAEYIKKHGLYGLTN